jgi:hypothetical protein
MVLRSLASLLLVAATAACRSEADTRGPGRDAGPRDTGVDAPVDVDAGPTDVDGGPVDGGPDDAPITPDAGSCPCPVVPTTCARPAPNVPTFAPDDAAYDAQLMNTILCAESTLEIAIYETGDDCIPNAIIARLGSDPDLTVDIVYDDDQCAPGADGMLSCGLRALVGHPRITMRSDVRSGLMHHKWVIADGARVWVSSGNFTDRSFCIDYNNAIVIEQAEILAAFEAQFARMFTMGMFGPEAPRDPVTGGPYAIHFGPQSPVDSPARWFNDMVARIGTATTSVDAMINAFTRTEVSDALIAAHMRGVAVRVVVSSMYVDEATVQALIASGVPVREANMHSKVLIVDGRLVITGSANWSASAWSNDENSLWIDDSTIAAAYDAEMDAVFAASTVP